MITASERFLKYVTFDTMSDEFSETCPSTDKQKVFGAYAAALNGIDVITFTAGVGENDGAVRAAVCEYLGFLGVKIDPEKNAQRGFENCISTPDSKVQVWVIPTNEELMIAQDTAALVK